MMRILGGDVEVVEGAAVAVLVGEGEAEQGFLRALIDSGEEADSWRWECVRRARRVGR